MKPKWILIAEDNPNDAELTLRAWRADASPAGEVVLAHDGSEALDCLYHRNGFQTRIHDNPALVLLDLKMPKVDGWEVLRQLKADERLKSIPVVVFSSSGERVDLAHCYEMGANAYVVKPVDFKEFVATVKDLRAFWMKVNEPPPESDRPEVKADALHIAA